MSSASLSATPLRAILVVDQIADWAGMDLPLPLVPAREYLRDPAWQQQRGLRVVNLCRSWRYQSAGYYVSLLAVSRRHTPIPSLDTVLRMRSRPMLRELGEELEELMQHSLGRIRSEAYELSIYFGRNLAASQDKLAKRLFNEFQAPLLRAKFHRDAQTKAWHLTGVYALPLREVPADHLPFLRESIEAYFAKPRYHRRSKPLPNHLAILVEEGEQLAPSDSSALERMGKAFHRAGFETELIGRDDISRLAEFDALFLRTTTAVNHYTFRFSQRAEQLGLAVIDDTASILRCTNKVFLAEALTLAKIPQPRTMIVDRLDVDTVPDSFGLPCVLKYPDSSFSQGVKLCRDRESFEQHSQGILAESDLMLVQEFLPTPFDWRIGVLGGEPLYACRYHMAAGHWQIVKTLGKGDYRYGKVEPVPLEEAPTAVINKAVRATKLIGRGLYGVDLKAIGKRVVVIEVNDNPNLDGGCEDAILGRELYDKLASHFAAEVEALRKAKP